MNIDTNPSVEDFFRTTVRAILTAKKIQVKENTEFYIVNLLSKAVQSCGESAHPNYFEKPLAILFGQAFSATNPNEKYSFLKHLGDQSLFVSGFFGDSLRNKIVDIDYYISMGTHAYGCLSDIAKYQTTKDLFSSTFHELSGNFIHFVDLFSEISEQANMTSNQDVLRMYERWLKTKNQNLLEKLQKMGIQPVDLENEGMH